MSFTHALSLQGKVIAALTLRETRSRYGSSKLGYFWALFEPFAHVMVFIGIFSALDRAPPIGQSTGLFILTGIIPWLLFSNIVNGVMGGLQANKALLGYPQVMPMDISISRVILESSTLLLVLLVFLAIAAYLGFSIRIDSFLQMMSATGLLIIFSMGVGMINAALVAKYPSYKSIYSSISRPLYFISGVFFTADFLSPEVYDVVSINPLLHLIEWFRSGFYTSYSSDLYDPKYTIVVCVGFFVCGLAVERINSKKVRQVSSYD
jgi:capsular polysaccharide transport system permease protein